MNPEVAEQVRIDMREAPEKAANTGASITCARFYSDPELASLETSKVFAKSWMPLVRESELPESGSFRTVNLADRPIIVLRDFAGNLHCLHNVCPHRGAQIVRTSEGQVKELRCPYHNFTFQLDGTLAHKPEPQTFCESAHSSKLDLSPIHHSTYAGWVWGNLEQDPAPLKEYLGDELLDELSNWPLAECEVVDRQVEEAEFDWKLGIEAFLEPFHVPAIHSRTAYPLVDFRGMAVRRLGPHSRMALPFRVPGAYDKDGILGEAAHQADVPVFADLNRVQREAHFVYLIFPNTILMLFPNHLLAIGFLPRGAGRCEVSCDLLALPGRSAAAGVWLDSLKVGYKKLLEEDLVNLPWIQRGVSSGQLETIELSGYERRIGLFRDALGACF